MTKDLTTGNSMKILFFFTLPMLIGNIFQQLYNIVDSVIVGNFVGPDALAAVGASYPIVFLSVSVATGLSMGCSVVVSQQFGAARIKEMKTTVSTAIISLFGFAVIISLIGTFAAKPLLQLLKTPENIIEASATYLRIYFIGAVFLFLYNILNSIYNALGDSKTPLKFLIFATIINIILDYSFVVYFDMGVAGVAWATLIAQGVSAILSFYFLIRKIKCIKSENENENKEKHVFFDLKSVKRISKVGIPSMIQQSLVSVSMMFMQGLVNSYGSNFVAGYTAATKIDSIAMMPLMNFSNALSTYTAQNIGAGKSERVKSGYKSVLFMVLCFCIIITFAVYVFGPNLIGIFMNNEKGTNVTEVLNYGVEYMKVVSIFYILMGLLFATNGVLRGSGDIYAFLLSSMINLVGRIVGAYILASKIGSSAIWWSIPLGWGIGALFSILRFLSGKWKYKAIVKA